MPRKNLLVTNPPYAVEQSLRRLGANLREARLRRNLTILEVAAKIGTGRDAVIAAEKGNPSTSIAVYTALLWAYGLLHHMDNLADPAMDEEGLALSMRRERARSENSATLDNDF